MKRVLAALTGLSLGLAVVSCGGPDAPPVQSSEQPNTPASTKLPSRETKPITQGLTRRQTVRGEAQKFLQALGYSNQAGYLLTQHTGSLYSDPQLKKIIELRIMALEAAKSVDIEILNSIVDGFGTHFRDDFMIGVGLFLEAVQSSSDERLGRSRDALNRWADWYDANRARIEVAVNAEQ